MSKSRVEKMFIRAERLEGEFRVDSLWKHHNGREYVVLGVANIANFNPKYRPVVVYRSVQPTQGALLPSRLWTKSPANFRLKMSPV